MGKGQSTREHIIHKAARLFNIKGVAGASMSDLMDATGLKKGGIYNHFSNKSEISVEAFDYAINEINKAMYAATRRYERPVEKLRAVLNFHHDYALRPIIKGGCPILNTAVEADDTNPELKERVQAALTLWIDNLTRLIERGKETGEFRREVDARRAAVMIVSSLEGGIALARSFDDNCFMETVIDQLNSYVDRELCT